MKQVMLLAGAGQIGMAIARRMGYGRKILVGDKNTEHAQQVADILKAAGFDALPMELDLASRESIRGMIAEAQKWGEIAMLVNAAGVSPSQEPIEAILQVDLYGTAVLLEEVGKVIAPGGVGVTVSSQSGHRMKQLTPRRTNSWPVPPRKNCSLWTFCSRNISVTPCTPTSWPSDAMKSGSWRNQSSGANGERGSIPSRPASLSPRLHWTSSMARGAGSIRICSRNARQAAPVRRTKWQTSQSF